MQLKMSGNTAELGTGVGKSAEVLARIPLEGVSSRQHVLEKNRETRVCPFFQPTYRKRWSLRHALRRQLTPRREEALTSSNGASRGQERFKRVK